MEKISVIIPIYNTGLYLKKCLDSVLRQTFSNLDVLLINDGSSDNSSEICKVYQSEYANVRYFEFNENRGVSYARNFGIENAIGTLIGFVDSDDWIEDDMYSTLYDLMTSYNTSFASANYNFVYESNSSIQKNKAINNNDIYIDNILNALYFYISRNDVILWNKLYKRELFNNISFPVGEVYEDTRSIHLLIEKAGSAAVSNKYIYNYFQRPQSITRKNVMTIQAIDHIYVIIERYKYLAAKYNCEELEKLCRRQIFTVFLSIVDEINHIKLKELDSIYKEYITAHKAVFEEYSFDNCGLDNRVFILVEALSKGINYYKIKKDYIMSRYV